jgi:hypothetical protein
MGLMEPRLPERTRLRWLKLEDGMSCLVGCKEVRRDCADIFGARFLLKYVNRDTVELLQKGTGGVQEVRGVVEKYQEKSPLYGLLQYRRKKVILKYVPEGTSRLLQGSSSHQYRHVCDVVLPLTAWLT